MKRYLVFREKNGSRTSNGTLLDLGEVVITSHTFDDMASVYSVSTTGTADDARRVISVSEVVVPAPGVPNQSIAPYVYRIELQQN